MNEPMSFFRFVSIVVYGTLFLVFAVMMAGILLIAIPLSLLAVFLL